MSSTGAHNGCPAALRGLSTGRLDPTRERRSSYSEAQDIARAAAQVEQEALDDLRELLCNDTRLVNIVLRSAGVEP